MCPQRHPLAPPPANVGRVQERSRLGEPRNPSVERCAGLRERVDGPLPPAGLLCHASRRVDARALCHSDRAREAVGHLGGVGILGLRAECVGTAREGEA